MLESDPIIFRVKNALLPVLLTKRPMTMPRHPGQISFPGGRREPFETMPSVIIASRHMWA